MTDAVVRQQDLDLPDGVLRLTSLSEDRLILAELIEGSPTRYDILTTIGGAGIAHGIIERGVDAIAQGYEGQVPVAHAEVIELPGQTSCIGLDLPLVEEVAVTGRFEKLNQVDVSFPVKAGQSILSLSAPPRIVIRYPNGQDRVLYEHEPIDSALFAGKNTSVNEESNTVLASIDGLAHRTVYGIVCVYPTERAFGIGSAHGKLWKESAFVIEQDISDGSHIETISTLIVRGAVHGSLLQAAGNIQISFAADNPTRNREARFYAGQSFRSRALDNTPVWAGSNVIVTQGINRCDIQCMDTLITPTIASSKITVGNRLITRNVRGYTEIKLGARFVTDLELRAKRGIRTQHTKRFSDLEQRLIQNRFAYNKTRENLVRHIERMRSPTFPASQRHKARQTLIRLFNALDETLETYKRDFGEYVSTARELAREQVTLDYYQQRLNSFNTPQIMVYGTMETGTQIQGPIDRLVLRENFANGRISLDPYTGRLTKVPLVMEPVKN